MSFETVVQTAIYNKLINDAALMAAVVSLSDNVLQGADSGNDALFPYVTIGEDVHNDISTDTELIDQVSITIHVWSRHAGRSETKLIQGLIYDSLNRANLVQSGYKLININRVDSQAPMDSDGFTRHGIQTFNLLIEEL